MRRLWSASLLAAAALCFALTAFGAADGRFIDACGRIDSGSTVVEAGGNHVVVTRPSLSFFIGRSLVDVMFEPRWIAVLVGSVLLPLVYFAWRRTALAHGRAIGAATSAAAAAGVVASAAVTAGWERVDGAFWVLVVADGLFAAAFLVAPAPRDPDALDAAETSRLLRRHRESFRVEPR